MLRPGRALPSTFPFPWRRRLAQDGALLGRLTRIVTETVLAFYAARAAEQGWPRAKSGAVTVVQRTSSDLRLNPHLHLVVLDGAWYEEGGELAWEGLSHLGTSRLHAHGLIAKIPRSRRWRVSLAGRRTMSTAIKLRDVAYPALFAATA